MISKSLRTTDLALAVKVSDTDNPLMVTIGATHFSLYLKTAALISGVTDDHDIIVLKHLILHCVG